MRNSLKTLSDLDGLPLEQKRQLGLVYTPSEIAQQPETWRMTLSIFKQQHERIRNFLEEVGVKQSRERQPFVVLVGAGSSDYIGRGLLSLLRRKWCCDVAVCASTDLISNLDDFVLPDRPYLFVSFSRSGDSPEGVAVIEHSIQRYPQIAHLVITCNSKGRMATMCAGAKNSCVVLLDDAVNDRSLAMTSSFTNMLVMGQCLAHTWSVSEYTGIMDRLACSGSDFLLRAAVEAERAASLRFPRVCLVGDGSLLGVATESALKILEMTAGGVKTMSESVLGLRHGPMAALDAQTLLICFVSQDQRRSRYAHDLLHEIAEKKIVGHCVAVGPASQGVAMTHYCDSYLSLPDDIEDAYRPVLDVIFGQLLGLYSSMAYGLKPDAPSPGGVISRVVKKFRIY